MVILAKGIGRDLLFLAVYFRLDGLNVPLEAANPALRTVTMFVVSVHHVTRCNRDRWIRSALETRY